MNPSRPAIAIVGIGCRFPGGIDSPSSFWNALVEGVDAIGPLPPGRYDPEPYLSDLRGAPGKMVSSDGGYLGDIASFDARFFDLSPREAERLDPQHRLLLEVSWEALEDAGIPADALVGSDTGVFVGLWLQDYESRLFADAGRVDFHDTTGTGRYAAPGRISHALGLQGPSISFDTACSSSLVAVHSACRALQAGDCALALAGGANTILQPHITLAYARSGMMAPDARCKFGDARADGYVRSDGAGMVVLKRLDDAVADGDPIHAVILGGAVNNDGRSGDHFVNPSQAGQEQMLRAAWADAGVEPRLAAYVEAHGTGTAAGDPVELGAVGTVMGAGREAGDPCLVGSVKTNLGHTEGAAGVAGLIKAALAIEHSVVPASLHHETPNPSIPWDDLHVRVPTAAQPIASAEGGAYVGVSSFGIAGTNAHLVLGHAAAPPTTSTAESAPAPPPVPYIVPISANDPQAVRERCRGIADAVRTEGLALPDLAYTLGHRRSHLDARVALVAGTIAELIERLARVGDGEGTEEIQEANGNPPVVMVFPGQGSQWSGMARALYGSEPVFRRTLESCEEAMKPFVDWSLTSVLGLAGEEPLLPADRIDIIQPTLVAVGIALARLWQSWGILPTAVVGHSMGEVAAAHVSGALGLDDAMRVICERSRLMLRLRGKGAMAMVELSLPDAEETIADRANLSIAAANSPRSTVVAGPPEDIDALLVELERRQVFGRRVAVDVASHSRQVDELREELLEKLAPLSPGPSTIPFASTVEGAILEGSRLGPEYWVRNLREPVRFSSTVGTLVDATAGRTIFLEVSPHPVLVPAIEQTVGSRGIAVGSLRREEDETRSVREAAGRLWSLGAGIDLTAAGADTGVGDVLRLPPYPWQRSRHWIDADERDTGGRGSGHPLLGRRTDTTHGVRILTGRVDLQEHAYLADHRVRGRVVMPAAAFLDMALTAASIDGPDFWLERVHFDDMLELDVPTDLELVCSPTSAEAAALTLLVRGGEGEEGRVVAGARVVRTGHAPAVPEYAPRGDEAPVPDHVRLMTQRGLEYGPAFQGVSDLHLGTGTASASVDTTTSAGAEPGEYSIHPALLDAALQVALACVGADVPAQVTLVPVSVGRIRIVGDGRPVGVSQAFATRTADLTADLVLRTAQGTPWAVLEAIRFAPLSEGAAAEPLHVVGWPEAAPLAEDAEPVDWLVVGGPWSSALATDLGAVSASVTLVAPEEDAAARTWLAEPGEGRPRGVVLHVPPVAEGEHPMAAQARGSERLLSLLDAIAPSSGGSVDRLCIVTPDSRRVVADDACHGLPHACLWGMGAVLAHERPGLSVSLLDVGPDTGADAVAAELRLGVAGAQVALRGTNRYAASLQPFDAPARPGTPPVHALSAYRVASVHPGILDSLAPVAVPRSAPGPGEIEIEIAAAGLNFMNVLSALGACPGFPAGVGPLGIECAGLVSRVGAGVDSFTPGQRVAAFAHDSLGSHAVVSEHLAMVVPEGIDLPQAAGTLIAYLTAYYALEHLARLAPGERVLIHSASGGVGLAAVHLARRIGATVLASAGSEEKRAWLRNHGVEDVFDSRSLAFADAVLEATDGRGVDVVINSLSGEAITKGLDCLAPYGRFVELGKRDIYEDGRLDLAPFRRNLSYFAVDLELTARRDPRRLGSMLDTLERRWADGELKPLPIATHPLANASEAFRTMAAARHIGKLVVTTPPASEIEPIPRSDGVVLDPRGTYLVTGGLGALGLVTARWAAKRGAGTLLLVGRTAPDAETEAELASIRALGTDVRTILADVTDEDALSEVLEGIDAEGGTLRGVFHAAGLLDDATLDTMDLHRFRSPMAPKVQGAWALHRLTRDRELDLFVLFSSVAGVLGTPGQANYAAANSFMDALAGYRRHRGLAATSIAWGPWRSVGLAAQRDDRGARLEAEGLRGITPDQGVAALGRILASGADFVVAGGIDAARWQAAHPAARRGGFLAGLEASVPGAGADPQEEHGFSRELAAAAPEAVRDLVLDRVLLRLAEVLRLTAADVRPSLPFKRLGMDSLMALELRNRLEADLAIPVSATSVWNYPTAVQLSAYLVDRLGGGAPEVTGDGVTPPTPRPDRAPAAQSLDGLEHDDLAELLDRELAASDELLADGDG